MQLDDAFCPFCNAFFRMMCAEEDSEKKRSSIEFSISALGSSIFTVLKSVSASSIWKSIDMLLRRNHQEP